MPEKIVIIDDEPIALKQLRRIFEKEGHQVSAYSDPLRALQQIEESPCDLVISDIKMPSMSGLDLMVRVKALFPDIEVILITGHASLDGAVEATKEGAFHYLQKPFTPDQLRKLAGEALERRRVRLTAAEASESNIKGIPVIIGKSSRIREVVAVIDQVAPTDCNVMISGESGTGKELAARAIHAGSPRAKKPFIAFNCGAFSEALLDNELFGHEKGAYTGADSDSRGLLEAADGGTLFLDEIGEMPHAMQVKLLRVLQEGELIRVGGRKTVPVNVRVVSATAKDIKVEVREGAFRKDSVLPHQCGQYPHAAAEGAPGGYSAAGLSCVKPHQGPQRPENRCDFRPGHGIAGQLRLSRKCPGIGEYPGARGGGQPGRRHPGL